MIIKSGSIFFFWGGGCLERMNLLKIKIIAEKSASSPELASARHGVTRESGQECMSAACIPRMHMHLIKRVEQARVPQMWVPSAGAWWSGEKGVGGRADPRKSEADALYKKRWGIVTPQLTLPPLNCF
jgi:hypothetical protein